MDWAPYNIDSVDYASAPPPPVSFFHPTLEAQLFGDEGYVSTDCSPNHVASTEILSTCGVGPSVFNSSASSCDETDFNDIIGDTLSENLLNNEPLSLLSAEEIFSQIDYSELHQTDNGGCDISPNLDLPFHSVKDEYCYQSATSSRVQSPVNDPLAIATAAFLVDDSSLSVISSDTSSIDNGFLTDQSLDKVELDIAKLKQEVDSTSDEDSLWSDFFSEDDPSEISPEYENLLKSLLSTPIDDIDVSLNVFNNVDEEESEQQADEAKQALLVHNIMSDHCYTLPLGTEEMMVIEDRIVDLGTMTPPNSGDDYDSESESDQLISSPSSVQSCEIVPKFINPKTVKLKHKKDLKFVFSFKVKDEANSDEKDIIASSLANSKPVKSTSQLCKKSLYKGVSVLKRNLGGFHHNSSLQLNQNISSHTSASIKRTLSGSLIQSVSRRVSEDGCEASMAVKNMMLHDPANRLAVNRAMKMQTDREIHNSMERQRRIQLKSEFDTLKDRIPEIRGNDKVSKLNVLNVAAGYVKKLEKVEGKLRTRKHQLREQKRRLIQQLALLNQT